jgi:hypothetical protein
MVGYVVWIWGVQSLYSVVLAVYTKGFKFWVSDILISGGVVWIGVRLLVVF